MISFEVEFSLEISIFSQSGLITVHTDLISKLCMITVFADSCKYISFHFVLYCIWKLRDCHQISSPNINPYPLNNPEIVESSNPVNFSALSNFSLGTLTPNLVFVTSPSLTILGKTLRYFPYLFSEFAWSS